MHSLTVGISLVLAIGFTNCQEVDYRVRAKWIYVNETNSVITFRPPGVWSQFDIAANSSTVFEQDSDGPKDVTIDSYVPPLGAEFVVFDGTKCLLVSETGAYLTSNYASRKIEDRYYEFTFTFTQNHFNLATPCN